MLLREAGARTSGESAQELDLDLALVLLSDFFFDDESPDDELLDLSDDELLELSLDDELVDLSDDEPLELAALSALDDEPDRLSVL